MEVGLDFEGGHSFAGMCAASEGAWRTRLGLRAAHLVESCVALFYPTMCYVFGILPVYRV